MEEYYNKLKNDVHNVSYWFPKIKDCGIRVPETFVKEVPVELFRHLFMDNHEEDIKVIFEWVQTELIPSIPENLRGLIFVKNGTFSNKFDFNTCAIRCNSIDLTRSIIEINYASLILGAGGNTEIVIRERIPFQESIVPTIYHGMPLRTEYRVFYDFDNKKPLYIENYWDVSYCHSSIARNMTDKIVYESVYPELNQNYENHKDCVLNGVAEHLSKVEGFSGIWSVDILEDEKQHFWLIDMALGYRSAYWDPEKAGVANG